MDISALDSPPTRRGRRLKTADRSTYIALLEAAETCLETKTYERITVRELAERSGVDAAMISYYFGSKRGLFVGLIGFVFADWKERLLLIERSMQTPTTDPVEPLVEAVLQSFYAHRSVVALLGYESMRPDSDVRSGFLGAHASRASGAIRRLVEVGIQTQHFRANLQPDYTAYAVATLAIHPLAMGNNLEPTYGFGQQALYGAEWRDFLTTMLRRMLCP